MRLNRLKIEEFRGIRCTELEFSDKGILIYGPNGVGKSSTLIALEYLLTGTVSRLTGRGEGRKPLEHALVHKKADSREDSKVTAEFSHRGESVEIRRCVADGELEVLSSNSATTTALAELTSAVEDQQNVLSRQELLQFINATDSDRSKALNTILRIDDIDEYRMTLQRAHRNISNK
ncbi:AAA family ATPase, partial [Haloferax sp. Atlit-10N]|uniref:AAA family ATPase n=1 Tax=Haloferax sp. Atlit-10N TaxID=2077204 RepID=UPI0013147862